MIDPPESEVNLRDDFPSSPARDAVVAVVRAYGTVQRLMARHFARFDLTPPQFQLLTIANRLREQRPTQRQLARELYVSFPNITLMVARLERAGLIRRRSNAEDKREKRIELTERGRSLLRTIWKVHQDQLDCVMAGLSEVEQKRLTRLLHKLMAAHAKTEG
jgi:MarR family 2-MHQ and catechol resistance regulon transcriptional repressor